VAACCQLAVLLAVTLVVWFFEPHNFMQETRIAANQESFCIHYLSLLMLTYLIFAIGFSFSESKSVCLSAECFRGIMSPEELEGVATQFGIPAILLVGTRTRAPR
jgi:hypothetical protein